MTALSKVLIVICLAGIMAGCVPLSPIPNCPTDDVYHYMDCAKPTVGWIKGLSEEEANEYLYYMVDNMDLFCTDARTEWLPALDKGVRDAYPEIRKYLKDGQFFHDFVSGMYAIEGKRFESLKGRDLHRAVVALFVWDVMFIGRGNYFRIYGEESQCYSPNPMSCRHLWTGNCTGIFQRLGDGDALEALKRMQQQ